MSRREERLEQIRKERRKRTLLTIGAGAAAVLILAVAIVLAVTGPSGPDLSAGDLPRISPEETYSLIQAGEAVLLDVRSAEIYEALHAQDAISLPEVEAIQRMAELPDDRLLVFY